MADKPKDKLADSDAEGAGTSAAPATAQDLEIATLRAQLAASQAQAAAAQAQAAQAPAAPATFSAPTAELIGMHDSATGLVQQLPQKLWDMLSDEDQARFTPYVADKPAALPTV